MIIRQMKKIVPVLLLGVLSILFAEVLAGSSKLWYLNPFATALLFSVYLCQLIFFFWIAQRFQRTSLTALYFLGVIFGLYESWITKVLWAGYQNTEGPGMGLFAGVGDSRISNPCLFLASITGVCCTIFSIMKCLVEKQLKATRRCYSEQEKKTYY